jgi:hypothetical protein
VPLWVKPSVPLWVHVYRHRPSVPLMVQPWVQ